MTVEIKAAHDPAAFSAICKRTFREAYADLHPAEDIDAYCDANYGEDQSKALLADPGYTCRMAVRGTDVVGFSTVHWTAAPYPLDPSSAELKQIYVLPSEFGRGTGTRLLRDAESSLRERGIQALWLCVADINQRARTYYGRQGFKTLGKGPVLRVGKSLLGSAIIYRLVDI